MAESDRSVVCTSKSRLVTSYCLQARMVDEDQDRECWSWCRDGPPGLHHLHLCLRWGRQAETHHHCPLSAGVWAALSSLLSALVLHQHLLATRGILASAYNVKRFSASVKSSSSDLLWPFQVQDAIDSWGSAADGEPQCHHLLFQHEDQTESGDISHQW